MSRTGVAVAVLAIIVCACSSGGGGAKPPVVACTGADDCYETAVNTGFSVFCCLNKTCAFSTTLSTSGSLALVDCTDANVQLIQASNYDRSCRTDSDCVAVSEGNACTPGFGNCPMATINVGAMAQYNADVAKTNAGICAALSSCGFEGGPCCVGGMCQIGQCPVTFPADASADGTAADAGDGGPSCDANPRIIQASSYDQTCTADSDCTGITEGNSCNPCSLSCVNAAINVHALPQYTLDSANIVGAAEQECPSSCGGPENACCRGGTCQWGSPSCPYVLVGDDAGATADARTDGADAK